MKGDCGTHRWVLLPVLTKATIEGGWDLKPTATIPFGGGRHSPPSKISESLVTTLKQLQPDSATTVIVIFEEPLTPEKDAILASPAIPRHERLEMFRASSIQAQEASVEFLKKKGTDYFASVKNVEFEEQQIKPFPHLNALVTKATAKLVEDLAEKPNILTILPNQNCDLIAPTPTPPSAGGTALAVKEQELAEGITWGLKYLKIDQIWEEYGFSGEGILVGHLDTGVYSEHPDLRGKVSKWAFFDPLSRELDGFPPFDTQTHGTHTAGIIVGGNSSGVAIGVAPEAKLASAGMLVESAKFSQILAGMEWAIRHQVSVLSMSLGFTSYSEAYEVISNRLIEREIFPCFAIGNDGLGNTKSPANSPNAVGVGAIDWKGDVPSFSSGATLSWYNPINGTFDHDIKPDLCAPGVAVFSSVPPLQGADIYASYDGTSMAAPYVAGVAALLMGALQKTGKAISVRSLIDLIYKHAIQFGDPGHNNRYGRGIINPLNTLRELLEE